MIGRGPAPVSVTPAGWAMLNVMLPGSVVIGITGSRLLLAAMVGSALLLAINAVWSTVALRSVTVAIDGPPTATIGTPVALRVRVARPGSPLECEVRLEGGGPLCARTPATGDVSTSFGGRGEVGELTVAVATSIPLGMLAMRRRFPVALDRAVVVVPPAVPTPEPEHHRAPPTEPEPGSGPDRVDHTGPTDPGGEPIGVRPYAPGDLQRDVHWPSVARTGGLVVRDRRTGWTGPPPPLTIGVVELDDELMDLAVGRARSVAEGALARGRVVRLVTAEPDGPVDRRVGSVEELLVRLARCRPGPIPPHRGTVVSASGIERWAESGGDGG